MPKASDLSLDTQSSLLLKGPFGFGKTLAAATFAVEGPVYLAYWDKKKPVELEHFFRHVIKRPDLLSRIEYDVYDSHNANEYLNKLMSFTKDFRYFAAITDSVTMMTSGAVNWSLGFRDNKKNKDKDRIIPDFDEYKVETSLVTQALDICRSLPGHIIWTCHPVPSVKIEGSGAAMRIIKTNPIVTYGSKVAGIIPGQFSEIYHFARQSKWDSVAGKNEIRYIVNTEGIGEDDFAKSNIGLKGSLDITDALFYEVWKDAIRKLKEKINDLKTESEATANPFLTPDKTTITSTTNNTTTNNQPNQTEKRWNSEKGAYE